MCRAGRETIGRCRHFVVKGRIERLDELEFPLRGKQVGGSEYAPCGGVVVGAGVPLAHAIPKRAQRGKRWLELVEHMLGKLPELFWVFFNFIVDGGLNVGNDEPVKIVEKPAFNHFCGQRYAFCIWQTARVFVPQHAGQQHFVRLFVGFKQFYRAQLVVPAQQVRARKDQLKQVFANYGHYVPPRKMATQKNSLHYRGGWGKAQGLQRRYRECAARDFARMAARPNFLDVRLPPATCHVPDTV